MGVTVGFISLVCVYSLCMIESPRLYLIPPSPDLTPEQWTFPLTFHFMFRCWDTIPQNTGITQKSLFLWEVKYSKTRGYTVQIAVEKGRNEH